jgi:hypothetical protein
LEEEERRLVVVILFGNLRPAMAMIGRQEVWKKIRET